VETLGRLDLNCIAPEVAIALRSAGAERDVQIACLRGRVHDRVRRQASEELRRAVEGQPLRLALGSDARTQPSKRSREALEIRGVAVRNHVQVDGAMVANWLRRFQISSQIGS
jgi:hypothetical protein